MKCNIDPNAIYFKSLLVTYITSLTILLTNIFVSKLGLLLIHITTTNIFVKV